MKKLIKICILYPLEALIATSIYFCLRLIPMDAASALGSKVARAIGPRLKVNRIAEDNIRQAFPEKSDADIATILEGMWDNLGRVFFEYPHIPALSPDSDRVTIEGVEHIEALRDNDKPCLFLCAHIGNWETLSLSIRNRGLKTHLFYRAPNNPLVDWLFKRGRSGFEGEQIKKGAAGAKKALIALKNNENIGMLVDQKMNDGIAVPFFGRDAMTAPAIAQFALKFDCQILPIRSERLEGATYKLTAYPPLKVTKTGNRREDVYTLMCQINGVIEDWIKKRPAQWLWVHRRWPKG